MSDWPSDKFYRVTRHAKPRYQLYQPGFNSNNGCWLLGEWITLPKGEWERLKDDPDRMYTGNRSRFLSQHHKDDGVAIEAMTPAQRQAWEFNSGSCIVTATDPNGRVSPVSIEMAGRSLTVTSQEWLRQEGYLLLRWVKTTNPEDPLVDQLAGLDVPEDLVSTSCGLTKDNPADPWKRIVEQNLISFDKMFETLVQGLVPGNSPTNTSLEDQMAGQLMAPFTMMMAFQQLVEEENQIIRIEWSEQCGKKIPYLTLAEETPRYVQMRKNLCDTLGQVAFDTQYVHSKAVHNECSRANLDSSDGHIFAFVLPEFREDGSHDPWGPRDVPWNESAP